MKHEVPSSLTQDLRTLFEEGSLDPLSDGQLLSRFLDHREGAAFEAIVRRHGSMVWGVCRRVLGHSHDAEDAFQATFLVLVRRGATVQVREQVGPWLHGVARLTARKAKATRAKRRAREAELARSPEPAIATSTGDDRLALLDREVGRLPEKYRIPILLCDLGGMAQKDAADRLGWPLGTVSGRLSKARAILGRRLRRSGGSTALGGPLAALLATEAASASLPARLIGVAAGALSGRAIPSGVSTLMEGALRTMRWVHLQKIAASIAIGLAGLGLLGRGLLPKAAGTHRPLPPAEPVVAAVPPPRAEPPAQDKAGERVSISGVVLDASGQPLPWVSVGLRRKLANGELRDPEARTIADGQGRFTLPPKGPGAYLVNPVADLDLIPGVTRPEQLPEDDRPKLAEGTKARIARPLPATFVRQEVTIDRDKPAPEVTLRAIPHVTLTARFVDALGQPAPAGTGYDLDGYFEKVWWTTEFRPVPGRFDAVEAIVPLGLQYPSVEVASDDVWWTWSPDVARQAGDRANLERIKGDLPSIIVERVKGATLEVRVKLEGGNSDDRINVSVRFPNKRGGIAATPSANLQEIKPGVFRLDHGFLPGRFAEVEATADGYKGVITQEFRFTSGNQEGTIDLTLQPGERDLNTMFRNPVPITVLDPAGRPIPQPDPATEPKRSIACRVVDASTGLPIAGAEVEFNAEQTVDDAGESTHAWLEQGKTRTDLDGRFVVTVPEKYLPDPAPRRVVDARVTIKHPGYVTYWDTAHAREIATQGISATFPGFVAVRMLPARTLTGRLLDADGKPLAGVTLYKTYPVTDWPRDAEFPETGPDGRFEAKVPVKAALKIEFRATDTARNYVDIRADQTDLGDIRLAKGVRISGRIVDGEGVPVRGISVTTPSIPNQNGQPNFVETTDKDGRFQTDELPPGKYLIQVGQIHETEAGERMPVAVKDAPGVYIATPIEIRDGRSIPDAPTIRPVESVRFTATLEPTDPAPKDKDDPRLFPPFFGVRGTFNGQAWASTYTVGAERGERSYYVDLPKGLTDATLGFGGWVEWYRLGPDEPELFGPGIRLARVDADRPAITVRRPRATTIEVRLPEPAGLSARYVRQGALEALGVVFDLKDAGPFPAPVRQGDLVRVAVLPGEEVDLEATAPGLEPGKIRVKLAEGETRVVPLDPKPKP